MSLSFLSLLSLPLLLLTYALTSCNDDDPYVLSSELSNTASIVIYTANSYSVHRSELSLNHNYTSLVSYVYNHKDSQVQNITEQIFMDPFAYMKFMPSEFYNNETIVNISLYFTSDTQSNRFIGMGHFFENKNFSLIAQLYNKGHIKRQQFALEVFSNGIRDNYIYFGGIPQALLRYRQRTHVLRAIEGQIPWAFEIDGLASENERVLTVQRVVYMALDRNDFVVDKEVYEWLREEVFGELIIDGLCKEKVSVSNKGVVNGRMYCSKNDNDKFVPPEIYFVYDGQYVPLLYNDVNAENFFDIYFEYSSTLDGTKKIWFPKSFFANRVVLFDYDTHLITLHTGKDSSGNNDKENVQRNVNDNSDKGLNVNVNTNTNTNVIKVLLGVMSLGLGAIVLGVIVFKEGNYEMLFE